MNKKQRNRKLINQNKRNRMVNRRYISTIKTLSKLLKGKIKNQNTNTKEESIILLNNLYSMIDKATKKGVIHKNTAARKKSKFGVLISNL